MRNQFQRYNNAHSNKICNIDKREKYAIAAHNTQKVSVSRVVSFEGARTS